MSGTKRNNLGRGLSALLGDDEPANEAEAIVSAPVESGVTELPVEFMQPSPYQPRREFDEEAIDDLVSSIKDKGILQPILVRPDPNAEGRYEIIAGERRWRAAQMAQFHQVPVIVKEFSNQEALEVALVENLQRQDLSPLEEADGYARLMNEFEHTQEILAQSVGKSRSHVANMMRLLNLPEEVKVLLDHGALSAGHGRALLSADDPTALAKTVLKKGLNVRQTEKLVKKGDRKNAPRGATASPQVDDKDADTLALERDLSNMLGLKVVINFQGSGGDVTIAYDNLEQLDDILNKLTASANAVATASSDENVTELKVAG